MVSSLLGGARHGPGQRPPLDVVPRPSERSSDPGRSTLLGSRFVDTPLRGSEAARGWRMDEGVGARTGHPRRPGRPPPLSAADARTLLRAFSDWGWEFKL